MLAGAPSSVAFSSAPRAARGPVCPHCDAPSGLGAALCDYCGTTLGEPPRRSGLTQRALALDPESARIALETRAHPSPPVAAALPARRTLTLGERVLLICTLGLAWLWLRRSHA